MARRTRAYICWRIDQDYWRKLSLEERAYLERFNSEFYRAELAGDTLHPPELHAKCRAAFCAAQKDAATKGSDCAVRALRPLRRLAGQTNRYLAPGDFDARLSVAHPEDELVELLDLRRAS
jgi:hypothetical protein